MLSCPNRSNPIHLVGPGPDPGSTLSIHLPLNDGKQSHDHRGEDEDFQSPGEEGRTSEGKNLTVGKEIPEELFPHIPFKTDLAWCGTFSSNEDSLPFIGEWPGRPGMYYVPGYGGNGGTFSMNAAQMRLNRIMGKKEGWKI